MQKLFWKHVCCLFMDTCAKNNDTLAKIVYCIFWFFFSHYQHTFVANDCSRTSVACWTTRYVNGVMSFNPLALKYVPPDMTTSKLCEDLMLEIVWYCVYKNLWFTSMKKLETFVYIVGVFLPRKFKLIPENKWTIWEKEWCLADT
jgi:hypothetical protein